MKNYKRSTSAKSKLKKLFTLAACFVVMLCLVSAGCSNITEPESSYLREDRSPAWSPDGKLIAYYHYDEKNGSDYPTGLYTIDKDGKDRHLVIEGTTWSPSWSEDSKRLVFTDGSNISTVKIDGSNLTKIAGAKNVSIVRWSPDGSKIMFVSERTKINIYSLEKNNIKTIRSGTWANWMVGSSRILYLNGSNLLFCDTEGNSLGTFYKMNYGEAVDYSVSAFDSLIAIRTPDRIITFYDYSRNKLKTLNSEGTMIAFSPDSKAIVLPRANGHTKFNLFRVDIDGTNEKQITF
ncbi:MAG: hypothetical protein ACM3S2_20010 [Ignavibacteriales bacterium]